MAKKKKTESPSSELDLPLFKGIDLDVLHTIEDVTEEQADKESFESVDFTNSDRPPTCLEQDFPILKVNEISAIESNATKPIYMMSKWWARRRSSVFRQLLIAAGTKSPKDESKAAQLAWSLMYSKNHQKKGKFKDLKVLDIFMGGGTTVIEASRLGYDVAGVDLNPIAWWVVKNEVDTVPPEELRKMASYIEEKVKPQIMPFFSSKSPRGFSSEWKNASKTIDQPFHIPPESRSQVTYRGSEIIYTFWVKHIMCSDPACSHLTPQLNSSIVSQKALKIKCWSDCVCPNCGDVFDLEQGQFRMAPAAEFTLGESESPFASIDSVTGKANCPHCKKGLGPDWISAQITKKGKPKSKELSHTLLLAKKWMKGETAASKEQFGGFYGSTQEQDKAWFNSRKKNLKLIEVRGDVPTEFIASNFAQKAKTEDSEEKSSSGNLICGKCGRQQNPLTSIKLTGTLAPIFPYLVQGFDPEAKEKGFPYSGRYFDLPDYDQILTCFDEFANRKDLEPFWPKEALFYGYKTHFWGIPDHGYTHWYKMFTPRQLYVHSLICKTIIEAPEAIASLAAKSHALGAFQNYLRNNCCYSFWNPQRDTPEPHFSSNNYHPKATFVENGVFSDLGRGNFKSCIENVIEGLEYAKNPYDLKVNPEEGPKSIKVFSSDIVNSKRVKLICGSSTDLKAHIGDSSIDLIITDPPFGDNVNYAELADFFLVWLSKPLSKIFPDVFASSESPKTLEAVTNKARHPGEDEHGMKKADLMYDRLLTLCWKEAARVLKPAGLMAFTFHHDKDVAWVGVLDSLFKAGFYIESTFPIRSDASKGDGDFGAQKIEFDIVHVCRRRTSHVEPIYWATLRRRILESVNAKSLVLAQHRKAGLHLADLEVIIRGEVLEQYSKHYGVVQKNLAGEPMSVREILIEANSIAQSLLTRSDSDRIPDGVDAETRILLSLFSEGPSIEFDAARKRLRGSGVTLEELVEYGWVETIRQAGSKSAKLIAITERWSSLSRKRSLGSDLDQTHFAINCCLGNRQLDGKAADWEEWIEQNFKILIPSVGPLLKFMESNHFGSDYKQAIGIAYRTLERTLQRIKETDGEFKKASEQMSLFGN
jgi:putative DNA methylase